MKNIIFSIQFGIPFCFCSCVGIIALFTTKGSEGYVAVGFYVLMGIVMGLVFYSTREETELN